MNIKKILLAVAITLPILSGADINAQGVVVYKTDGTRIGVLYNNLDSIVTYETTIPGGIAADAVDLGLTSGTLWASWNVGASAIEELGSYYAWGETDGEKELYNNATYKYYNTTSNEFISIGDNISGTEYDVANVMWGDDWHMPTEAQIRELQNECTWTWIKYNDTVDGYLVTGSNGNSIFLPAAGYRSGYSLVNVGSYGHYWSSTFSSDYSDRACEFYFHSTNQNTNPSGRCFGNSIRPVKEK